MFANFWLSEIKFEMKKIYMNLELLSMLNIIKEL